MKQKQYKIIHWLNTGIFPDDILFSIGFAYEELIKNLKKLKADGWATGIQNDKNLIEGSTFIAMKREYVNAKGRTMTNFYIIIKNPFPFTDESYCFLAHEVLHICQFMLPDFLSRDREIECEAYLHTHLMTQCLKAIRGQK